jgi:hypothetical protein
MQTYRLVPLFLFVAIAVVLGSSVSVWAQASSAQPEAFGRYPVRSGA